MTPSARLGRRQAAVYQAEAEALAPGGIQWARLRPAQAYADALVGSDWFVERWPGFLRCHVERRGAKAVWSCATPLEGTAGSQGVIYLAPGHLNQAVLLHELAHLLVGTEAGHSPAFLAVQLELVRHEMGFPAWAAYRRALDQRGQPAPSRLS